MNHILDDLFEQAGGSFGNDGEPILPDIEVFAELIVKESCSKIEREYKYALGEKTQWAMSQDVQDLLKQHFGVRK